MKRAVTVSVLIIAGLLSVTRCEEPKAPVGKHDLQFSSLAESWDEAIPLGNGMLGALIWQNGDNLRFSLDRADLWDLRPMENLSTKEWKYAWVLEQWENNNYKAVQKAFDEPYDRDPAPSKIPAAAIEFNSSGLGPVQSVRLSVEDAVCEVRWESGASLQTFVHGSQQEGWFRFEGLTGEITPVIAPPAYNLEGETGENNPVTGQDLRRLGYPAGVIEKGVNRITYTQQGWGGFKYQVHVEWRQKNGTMEGCWSISSEFPGWKTVEPAVATVEKAMKGGFDTALESHEDWWEAFWAKSGISLPDSVLERQWYLEQYKFGAAARNNAPPISLQAVWTADNGKLPPWKGDFHHDLNTQLSYWPAYSSNHLDLEEGFLNWLWKYRGTFTEYTADYFGVGGLNVPGVTTLTGAPMGGWIQYSFGPTVSAWLSQHFYLHWRYSMDRQFLEERAYPWISGVALFLDELSVKGEDGKRRLPLSSSPEINDNSRDAWFDQTTNFDLALIRFTFEKASELAAELGKTEEAARWKSILAEWPGFAVDEKTGLKFAPNLDYSQSHRHFSHLMAIHPLGLIDWSQGEEQRQLIANTVNNLIQNGSDWWTGYSFSWLGNLQARMMDGEGAARSLRIFAENFCLPNSFHVNGEQYDRGYSKFKYRPFTLEGNFAFAAGVQEMLIQSHTGTVRIFPAIPEGWKNVSFNNLRTEGAFLISAVMEEGELKKVTVQAEKEGTVRIKNRFTGGLFSTGFPGIANDSIIVIVMKPGDTAILEAQVQR